ncbi:hypothetical protein GCM10025885_10090 [Tetragenococcus osmophilus]|uniref:Uncharacterized protein n=1 Tax=Tetragenococcus osmophilus TaxID=526944 RepID=A0AA37XLH4_9ENTE|nr:hypothetical protein GCM10025885_10090 [Tetragenococcus osmophilus]
MDKELLREKGMQRLKNLAEHLDQKQKKEKQITTLLFHSQLWKEAKTIAMVRSQSFEFNTQPIMDKALQEGKKSRFLKLYLIVSWAFMKWMKIRLINFPILELKNLLVAAL